MAKRDWVDRIIEGGSSSRSGDFVDKIIRGGSVVRKGDFVDKIIYGNGVRHPYTERIVNKPFKRGRIEQIASGEESTQQLFSSAASNGDITVLPDKLIGLTAKAGMAGARAVWNLPRYYEDYKLKKQMSEEARQQKMSDYHASLIAQQTASQQAAEQARQRQVMLESTRESQTYRDVAFRERVARGQTPSSQAPQQSLMERIRGAVNG